LTATDWTGGGKFGHLLIIVGGIGLKKEIFILDKKLKKRRKEKLLYAFSKLILEMGQLWPFNHMPLLQ